MAVPITQLLPLVAIGQNPGSGILGILESLRADIVADQLGALTGMAAAGGALIAAVVLLGVANDYMQGAGMTLSSLIRPVLLLMLIMNFNTFVATPIHRLCNIFTRSMTARVSVSTADYYAQLRDFARQEIDRSWAAVQAQVDDALDEQELADASDAQSEGGKVVQWLQRQKVRFQNTWKKVTVAALGLAVEARKLSAVSIGLVINSILMFIMTLFVFGQQVYCYVYLTLLTLLGPFAFALAIIPSFSHSIASWIARYVQVAFWIPIGQLVMYINVYLVNRLMDAFGQAYQLGQQWVIVAMSIVAIMNVAAVPKIAAYVVESTGANDAHSSSIGGIRETVQTAGALKAILRK
jgi:hypothetical protein